MLAYPDWKNSGFGIYLHWPYCESKCPYCDFNSYVEKNVNWYEWELSFLSQLGFYYQETGDRRVNSIFFGGGTPSLMNPKLVSNIINHISNLWGFEDTVEITLEANPSSVESRRFAEFKAAGVNRVSIGVQALNNIDLKKLGRLHSVQDALNAIEIGKDTFDRVSFDLIYARQDQKLQDWELELKKALTLEPDHLSLYQLTIEPNTTFGNLKEKGKLSGLPDENLGGDLYHLTNNLCYKFGLNPYEVSNYSRKNHESIHNKIYWNYGDYLGVGPGAHGRITTQKGRFATQNYYSPIKWQKNALNNAGESIRTLINGKDQADEMAMMGLRLNSGFSKERYFRLSGKKLNEKTLTFLISDNLITVENNFIKATAQGRVVLNSLILNILSD
ncbi:MAG: radical SAM family heme chaperone HemW [Paracoccaceae bacterium]|nr:radical SAM family heme chaperone HemW [Paracoccaceae bacterium]|tara:strand:- start:393 stop:1556 length:1164 start_codon:yes stop_codon:yes gene_type:complete